MVSSSGLATERTPLLGQATQETQFSIPSVQPSGSQDGSTSNVARSSVRQIAPDLLRGLLMVMMAEDHINVFMYGYPHGTASGSEGAARPVIRWVSNTGYIMRTLTHLCAPGFTVLLGMGIAFFIASRSSRGWTSADHSKHIWKRFAALLVANQVVGVVMLARGVWLSNFVMLALAVDYLVVGFLAIALSAIVEPALVRLWSAILGEQDGITQQSERAENDGRHITESTAVESGVNNQNISHAKLAAFHTVNLGLIALSAVTIWWNIWLDPQQGDCKQTSLHTTMAGNVRGGFEDENCTDNPARLFYNVLFRPVTCKGIVSTFPPMAWLPFAIFGLLYGRLMLAQTRSSRAAKTQGKDKVRPQVILETTLAIIFALLFVGTRLAQFGNLSTHCLRTPDQQQEGTNSYLASLKSFFFIVKYPPSPSFAFMTLSANFLLLALFSLVSSSATSPARLVNALRAEANPLLVYGRQPLFFYVIHMQIILGLKIVVLNSSLAYDIPRSRWDGKTGMHGIGLGPTFFLSYLVVLIIMYPLCSAYGRFKLRQPSDSIWRFF